MKKRLLISVMALCALLLSACGKTTEYVSQVHEMEGSPAAEETVSFSAEETEAMLNFMIGNRYYWNGTRLFGLTHDADGNELFCSMSQMMKKTDVLDRGCDCRYLTADKNGNLYYIRSCEAICRLNTADNVITTLYSGPCTTLQLFEEKLYFTDGSNHLLSMNTDGSGVCAVYDRCEIFYPYRHGNLLFFQSGSDESLYQVSLDTGTEIKLKEGPVYEYLFENSTLKTDLGKYINTDEVGSVYQYATAKAEVISEYVYSETLQRNAIDHTTVYYLSDGKSAVIPRGE